MKNTVPLCAEVQRSIRIAAHWKNKVIVLCHFRNNRSSTIASSCWIRCIGPACSVNCQGAKPSKSIHAHRGVSNTGFITTV